MFHKEYTCQNHKQTCISDKTGVNGRIDHSDCLQDKGDRAGTEIASYQNNGIGCMQGFCRQMLGQTIEHVGSAKGHAEIAQTCADQYR